MKITFRINFANRNLLGSSIEETISSWFPNRLRNNQIFVQGDLVTLFDFDALYFLDTYVNNPAVNIGNFITIEDLHEEVTAAGTATMVPVDAPTLVSNDTNSGHSIGQELTISGGTSSEDAVIVVNSLSTIAGQDETNFVASEGYGSFTGGDNYVATDTATMSDGSVVTVDAANVGEVMDITAFTITSASTTPITSNNDTLTQVGTSGSGSGFTLTLGPRNQGVKAASYKSTGGETLGSYTGTMPSNPVSVTPGSATFTLDWGVKDVTVTDGGNEYEAAPAVSFLGGGGAGTVATAVLDGDVVDSVTIDDPGSGYTSTPLVAIAAP